MPINQTLCTSFKKELMEGVHDFTSDTFKIALYSNAASIGAASTVYTSTAEVVGTGYDATGKSLTVSGGAVSVSGTTVFVDFDDVLWAESTISAQGALIYNSTALGNPAVAVLDFGITRSTYAETLTVAFPSANETQAIVRIS